MGHCLSVPHAATPVPTHKHPFNHKFKHKQPSYPHLQPIPKHHTRFITAIPSSPLPPPNRHVHFAPTPPLLPSHAHFTPIAKPSRPPSVRVHFTNPVWDSSSSSSSSKTGASSRPVSPLTTTPPPPQVAMAKQHKIKRKPLPPSSASINRSNATTTFRPSLRSSPSSSRLPAVLPDRGSSSTTTVRVSSSSPSSSSAAPPVPPKRPLSLSLCHPRVPPKIPLCPPPPAPPQVAPPRRVAAPPTSTTTSSHPAHYPPSTSSSLPSTTRTQTTSQLRGRSRRRGGSHNNYNSTTTPPPPRISRSRAYVPDLGRWECVRDGGKAVRSGGAGDAWMSGGLGGRGRGGVVMGRDGGGGGVMGRDGGKGDKARL